jgi:2-iminobutanoate/2-iminopropanoate deaminase
MEKQVIQTSEAPAPIGPYSQAVKAGNTLFISGQIALIPGKDQLANESIETEAEQVMKNLHVVLKAAGADFSHVAKTTIFLSSMDHFALVNEVYGRHVSAPYPARETVAVKGLPRGVNVEISMIAVLPA